MVLDMSWFGAMSGPPPHPRLSRVPRWCAPHPWDAFVAGACAYFCFGGPVVLFLLGLAPFLFLPMLLFLPLLLGAYWLLELAWFVHRWYLRYRHEPWTDPPAYPDRRKHLERFLRLKDDCVPCFRDYLSRWFRGADARLIRRENVREFVRYGFYGGVDGPMSAPEEEEIEWFVSEVERVWAVSFAPGKTEGLRFMRHMREPLRVMHQPLLFVAYSHCAEWLAGIILRCWGFVHLSCEDTGVTYWLRRGAAAAAARRRGGGAPRESSSRGAAGGASSSSAPGPLRGSSERPPPGSGSSGSGGGSPERQAGGGEGPPPSSSSSSPPKTTTTTSPSTTAASLGAEDNPRWYCRECGCGDRGGGLIRRSLDLLSRRGSSSSEDASGGPPRRCFAGCVRPPPPPPPRDPTTPTWAPAPPPRDPSPTPAVLLHGLGIGLPPYLWTVAHVLRSTPERPVALVCLPEVSLRAVWRVPTPDELVDAVEGLCRRHGLARPCLLGHSFGSFIVARACQRSRVAATVLVDPVASCLMLPDVIAKVLYQLEDRWREFLGRERAGSERVSEETKRGLGVGQDADRAKAPPGTLQRRLGLFGTPMSWRARATLFGRLAWTFFRDALVVRELSTTVALCRQFWWFGVCAWAEDMPARSLVVLQSRDELLDAEKIATHLLNRDAADVLWVEGFAHGELLAPQGYEARRRVVRFLETLDNENVAREIIGLGRRGERNDPLGRAGKDTAHANERGFKGSKAA